MALPKPPPAVEIPPDTKRAVLAGVRKIVEIFQAGGKLPPGITHADILHDPDLLSGFIAVFRRNPALYADLVVGFDGRPVSVSEPDKQLICGISLAQVQQLMVKTCARYLFLQDEDEKDKGPAKAAPAPASGKLFGLFKDKPAAQPQQQPSGGKDPRALREILSFIAFDWQLPLLADYAELSLQQLAELGENILALKSSEGVRELARFDYNMIRKARAQLGPEFPIMLGSRPAAIYGALYWPKDMYVFFRSIMGARFYDFLARDEPFFMAVATMDKAMIRVYGEALAYVAKENLMEMQRLNIDRIDVLMTSLRAHFGDNLEQLLGAPSFAKEILRKNVEGLVHMTQNKDHMQAAQMVTWGALAPRVEEWLSRQPKPAGSP